MKTKREVRKARVLALADRHLVRLARKEDPELLRYCLESALDAVMDDIIATSVLEECLEYHLYE